MYGDGKNYENIDFGTSMQLMHRYSTHQFFQYIETIDFMFKLFFLYCNLKMKVPYLRGNFQTKTEKRIFLYKQTKFIEIKEN